MRLTRNSPLLIFAYLVCASMANEQPIQAEHPTNARFSLSISVGADVKTKGSPVPIKIALTNTSDRPLRLPQLSSGGWRNYQMDVRDSQGAWVKAKPEGTRLPDGNWTARHTGRSVSTIQIEPGKVLDDYYPLDSDFELAQPGKYTVQASRYDDETKSWVKSNTISFTLVSKQPVGVAVEVWDPSGVLLPRAMIRFQGSDQEWRMACADAEGKAVLDLEPGNYNMEVSSTGFRTLKQALEVSGPGTQVVRYVLDVRVCTQCPTVFSTAPVFQTTTPSLAVPDASNQTRQFEVAFENYKRTVVADPSNAGLHNSLGIAYAEVGQYAQARAEFSKAAELDPAGASHAYFNLGAVLLGTGAPGEQAEAFRKAIDLDPGNADAYQFLGLALIRKANMVTNGRQVAPREAVEALHTYLKLQPKGMYAQWAEELITQGLPVIPPDPCAN